MIVNTDESGAVISDCQKYRYQLWRKWDDDKPLVMFIMLNPSTADGNQDDPTIRKCIKYAKSWGYGGICVGNLYAYRATDKRKIKLVNNPIGEDNVNRIKEMLSMCDKIVCAWGNGEGRPDHIFSNFDNLYYLNLNNDGTPSHPLYLSPTLTPKKFTI